MQKIQENTSENSYQNTFPRILAHRALGFGYRENTLKALKEALSSEVDEIELDFRLTKDNVYVCNHDPELKIKLKSGKTKKLMISKHTYDELNKNRKRIAPLDEILVFFAKNNKSNKILNLDLKDYGQEEQVIKLLKKYKLRNSTILISWIPKVLQRIRQLDKGVKISFSYAPIKTRILRILKLLTFKLRLTKVRRLLFVNKVNLQQFQQKHAKGYNHAHIFFQLPKQLVALQLDSINIPSYLVNKAVVTEAHKQNIKVRIFNIDSKRELNKLKAKKIHTIFTNEVYEL